MQENNSLERAASPAETAFAKHHRAIFPLLFVRNSTDVGRPSRARSAEQYKGRD